MFILLNHVQKRTITGIWAFVQTQPTVGSGAVVHATHLAPYAKALFSKKSRLTLQQILDLMMYWCQRLDSHEFIRRNVNLLSDTSIVDWKNLNKNLSEQLSFPSTIRTDTYAPSLILLFLLIEMNEPIDFLSFPVDDIDQLERGCRSSGEVPKTQHSREHFCFCGKQP